MLNSPSEMGKHPHPTTLSVAVTLPLRINNSKTRIMPGRTSGLDGQTVNTLWSIWKQRAVTKVIIGKRSKDPVNNKSQYLERKSHVLLACHMVLKYTTF